MRLILISINLHCLIEKNLKQKQKIIADEIIKIRPDVVFLQEVAQTTTKKVIRDKIKSDNYALALQNLMREKGVNYFLYYEPFKISFNNCDEGTAIMSKYEMRKKGSATVSKSQDYSNWKTRKIILYETKILDKTINLSSVHFGWDDESEKFQEQFDKAIELTEKYIPTIIAGDFNIDYQSKDYDHIINKSWFEIGNECENYAQMITFPSDIDKSDEGRKIDYFFANRDIKCKKIDVLFEKNRVSDHFGLIVELEI